MFIHTWQGALSDSFPLILVILWFHSGLLQIVDKALEEPKYSSLYAQLCLRLAEDAPNFDGPSSEIQTSQKQSTVNILTMTTSQICF